MISKKKILVVQKIHDEGLKLIENNSNYDFEVIENINSEILKEKIVDCDGLSIKTAKLPGEIISCAKKLKIISRHGVGLDNIDLKKAKEKNITIAITTKANAVTVAEHVFFLLLSICKGMNMYDTAVKTGNFKDRYTLPKTTELWNKNILIAGCGRTGQSLIKRCKGFEMNIFVYDPFVTEQKINSLGAKKVDSFEETVKSMDVISLHMPLDEKTKNIINFDLIKTMRKNCIIINASRGGIVNEVDLNEALNQNLILGAGLDVFEKEPPDKDNPLLKNKKVFLSPHTATFSEECIKRMSKETIQNLIDFFDQNLDQSKIVSL